MYNIELLFISGPTVITGPAGAPCTPGLNGATGASGANVAPRLNGAAGATVAAVTHGATSAIGHSGPVGPTGPVGPFGPAGANGGRTTSMYKILPQMPTLHGLIFAPKMSDVLLFNVFKFFGITLILI